MLVQQIAGGQVKWAQLPIYLVAELLAGAAAALAYGVLARTPADNAVSPAAIDLADPESSTRSSDFEPSQGQVAASQVSNGQSTAPNHRAGRVSRPDHTPST
jgi:hypothetical protein